jgi:hypothetical protein
MLQGISRGFIGLCVAIAVVVILVVGGWQLHKYNVQQEYEVNRSSQQYQQTLISELRNEAAGWHASTDEGQKAQIASTFCAKITEVNAPPDDLLKAKSEICA